MYNKIWNEAKGIVELELALDRDVSLEPRKPRGKGNLIKLSLHGEMHRKPRHKGSKVICYRLKEVD